MMSVSGPEQRTDTLGHCLLGHVQVIATRLPWLPLAIVLSLTCAFCSYHRAPPSTTILISCTHRPLLSTSLSSICTTMGPQQ